MPPPKDLWRIFIEEKARPGFPFDGWQNVLGNKRCFHLPGFTEVCEQLGFNNRADFEGPHAKIDIGRLLERARRDVPPEWKKEFGTGNETQQHHWDEFVTAQVMMCYKRQPMLLQKAAMSLIF